jgi:uncharacterized protein (DUF362 family)
LEYFVHIATAFRDSASRNLAALQRLYGDRKALLELIRGLFFGVLSSGQVTNKRIFLKPNWVKHDSKESDVWCMRAHDSFVLAALEAVLEMKPATVLIGDAPVQGCRWEKMITTAFLDEVQALSRRFNIPVAIKDFRRRTFDPSRNNPLQERNPLSDYTIFDLGKDSFLEPISSPGRNLFRVTNYDPDRLAESHGPGVHKYCITNALFEADVVISLPKVKTHQKAGITAALKNIVGLNGDKDYLPHHRMGGTGFGGDCYPGNNYLRYLSELSLDFANRRQGKTAYWLGVRVASLLWRLSFPGKEHHIAAGWHGNDTTWRMVLDLNKIVLFGRQDGSIAEKPQRHLFSLCDGIIGGQGDGPLKPDPLPLGIVSLTNHSGWNDLAMAKLMDFDIRKIPMLRAVGEMSKKDAVLILLNGEKISLADLQELAVATIPPPGWQAVLQGNS